VVAGRIEYQLGYAGRITVSIMLHLLGMFDLLGRELVHEIAPAGRSVVERIGGHGRASRCNASPPTDLFGMYLACHRI
jgi:hypothetical protein